MIKRKPSINSIQHHLFAPPYSLLTKWVEHPERLENKLLEKLESSSIAQQEKQAYLQATIAIKSTDPVEELVNELFIDSLPTDQNQRLPDAIQQLIQQRSDANQPSLNQIPTAGLMVLLREGNATAEELALSCASPVCMVLDRVKPTKSDNKNIWTGWIVATEVDYASGADMVLSAPHDGVQDPLARMVQAWNPLTVPIALIEKPIGQLAPERLELVRQIASKYKKSQALSPETSPVDEELAQYQTMYQKVASLIEAIGVKATLSAPVSPFSRWKTAFIEQAEQLGQLFTPVSQVHHAMSTESEEDKQKNWLFDDYLFNFQEQLVDGKLLIEISIKHTQPKDHYFTVEYRENGFLAHHATLSLKTTRTEFICDPDNCTPKNPTELIIKNNDGKELHRLNLSPTYSK